MLSLYGWQLVTSTAAAKGRFEKTSVAVPPRQRPPYINTSQHTVVRCYASQKDPCPRLPRLLECYRCLPRRRRTGASTTASSFDRTNVRRAAEPTRAPAPLISEACAAACAARVLLAERKRLAVRCLLPPPARTTTRRSSCSPASTPSCRFRSGTRVAIEQQTGCSLAGEQPASGVLSS